MDNSEMTQTKRTTEEYVVLSLSGFISIFLVPLCILRILQQDWPIAILDVSAVIATSSLFYYVFKTRKTKIASNILALLSLAVVVLTIYLKGAVQLYWTYPALVVIIFTLSPRLAILFVSLFLIALAPFIVTKLEFLPFISFYISSIATMTFSFAFAHRMRQQQAQLLELSIKDPLTNAGNRRAMENKLKEVVDLQKRILSPVSLIIFDLDKFKQVNDKYGHLKGDEILVQLCNIIMLRIRTTDSLFRFGGEEFVVITENSNVKYSVLLAEELREAVERCEILSKYEVTISSGTAQYQTGETEYQWLDRADNALYQAKDSGRNTNCVA